MFVSLFGIIYCNFAFKLLLYIHMEMFTHYNTIIFDLDGTLLNTLPDLQASCNYALQLCGFPQRSFEEVRCFVGNGVRKLMERAAPSDVSDGEFEKMFMIFKQHYLEHGLDRTAPYEGVVEVMRELKQRGFKTAVISNKFHEATQELCNHFFNGLLDMCIGEHKGFRRKPSPDMMNEVLSVLHANKATTVYVGDSDVDIETARQGGVSCISVLWGFRDRDFLLEHGATCLVEKPIDLLSLLVQ